MKFKKIIYSMVIYVIAILIFAGPAYSFTAQRIIIPYGVISDIWWSGLALHNQSDSEQTYSVGLYNEAGAFVGGDCVTVPAMGIHADALQNFTDDPSAVDGRVSAHIRTPGVNVVPFSATFFMGNTATSQGFGFQSYESRDYETEVTVLCVDIPPIIVEPLQ